MRQRAARPDTSGANRTVANPGRDPSALTNAAAGADEGPHRPAACGDARS